MTNLTSKLHIHPRGLSVFSCNPVRFANKRKKKHHDNYIHKYLLNEINKLFFKTSQSTVCEYMYCFEDNNSMPRISLTTVVYCSRQ